VAERRESVGRSGKQKPPKGADEGSLTCVATGTVKSFNDEDGWGVLTAAEVPGEVWVHFSSIEAEGYRELVAGQDVEFDWEHVPAGQDGYIYRACRVRSR
jgi:CspA family cold shock protein